MPRGEPDVGNKKFDVEKALEAAGADLKAAEKNLKARKKAAGKAPLTEKAFLTWIKESFPQGVRNAFFIAYGKSLAK